MDSYININLQRRMKNIIVLFVFFICVTNIKAQTGHSPIGACNTLSLAGEWSIKLDAENEGSSKGWQNMLWQDKITLPGTTDQARYGEKTSGSDYGILTRKYKYCGKVWYNKEINIPKEWKNKEVVLHLERVMWESTVWIDGRPLGAQDGLGTPHFHSMGILSPGKHILAICVDNDLIHNIGDKGHAYTEYTQTIWNGIVGEIELRALAQTSLHGLKISPDTDNSSLEISYRLHRKEAATKNIEVSYQVVDISTGKVVSNKKESILIDHDEALNRNICLFLDDSAKPWNEFTPNLYRVHINIKDGKEVCSYSESFGFRKLSIGKAKVKINGESLFLRGNLDCVHFPLTGHPSCDVEEWERIFTIYKQYGLNHVRFHSWCPPKAAFEAADKVGIYIQAEILWIDWWMTKAPEDRPEMITKGLPEGLGKNPSADQFVQAEMQRMLDAYGNHPSFVFFCIGNELGNSDFDVMQEWVKEARQKDDRRLYSVSTARKIMPVDQYMATHNIPNAGRTYGLIKTGTDFDIEESYSKSSIPIIAHEVGQYPVYPLWSEIQKYTGVVEARNLKEFKILADKNNIGGMDKPFHAASGALQTLLYKAHIEALLRTPSCAGFQMLSMTDYAGQGEALVGWLDSFWDSKGIVSPEEFRSYCSEVVPLARFDKWTWNANETFIAKIQLANYGLETIKGPMSWQFASATGRVIASGELDVSACRGKLSDIAQIKVDLSNIVNAEKFQLQLSIKGSNYHNRWPIWVYPAIDLPKLCNSNIRISNRLDAETLEFLSCGGKVLLKAHHLGSKDNSSPIFFTPLFWSNSFFPGQDNKTLGLLVDQAHPSLSQFPTDSHSNWQWQSISKGKSFVVNSERGLNPIAQPISDFHINDKLASIFECQVGTGKLLVCGYDLDTENMVGKQLEYSLLSYMGQSNFNPSYALSETQVKELFVYIPKLEFSAPSGFENAAIYIECAAKAMPNDSLDWSKEKDNSTIMQTGYSYIVSGVKIGPGEERPLWIGNDIQVQFGIPQGVIGDLFIEIENGKSSKDKITFILEGREFTIDTPRKGREWIKLFVMREDTNDGKVVISAQTSSSEKLKIKNIAFVKQ
ncbi:beta-galactosidase [Bacteroidales bacterium]|nr:beta-galactosidase [Bacteroidales bacterium]